MRETFSLAWGILGTGGIANTFAGGMARVRNGKLVAVASRAQAPADEFAAKHGGIKAYGSYEGLLADPKVQIVYIGTPHSNHADWCLKAIEAGKHVVCEKPLTLNFAEAKAVIDAARKKKVFLMEAFMNRFSPHTQRALEIVRNGEIGEVGIIKATFGFDGWFQPGHRMLKNDLGGGGILDLGCYPISICRLIAGAAQGKPYADPIKVSGSCKLHPEEKTDLYATAALEFSGNILAQVSVSVGLDQDNGVHVYGTKGQIHTGSPFVMGTDENNRTMRVERQGKPSEEIKADLSLNPYTLEAEAAANAIASGKLECDLVSHDDTLSNMATLDAWRDSAGFVLNCEKK